MTGQHLLFKIDRYYSQLTVDRYCSRLTVGHNTKICITTHFQQCLPAGYCNTIHLPLQYPSFPLQYNSLAYLQASLQYNSLYCNTIFQPLIPPIAIPFLSQKDYIAIQSVSHQAPLLQYNSNPTSLLLQYKTKPTTLSRLQYNSFLLQYTYLALQVTIQYYVAIQFFIILSYCLQYNFNIATQNFLSHNTKWAVAHQNFLLKNFFFAFFIINDFFFSFIFRNWKNL